MSEGLEVYRDRGNGDVEYGGDVCSTREGEEDRWIEREGWRYGESEVRSESKREGGRKLGRWRERVRE